MKGSPRPAWCCSPHSTNSFSSLEPSHPFGSRLAPVIAANGPGSSHPPGSSNGVVLPLICMIPFLSQGSNWPISLATPWTAIGDPASPRPSSSPYHLVLACPCPFPLPMISENGQGHSLLRWIPSSLQSAFVLSYPLDFSLRGTEMCYETLWLRGIGCWDREKVHWGH